MAEFQYVIIASILHDAQRKAQIASAFSTRLAAAGGEALETSLWRHHRKPDLPLFLFILTGGTEAEALRIIQEECLYERQLPVVLLAHSSQNSLPAALEILARVGQDGGQGIIVQVDPKDDSQNNALEDVVASAKAQYALRSTRIGVIGSPSDWLVASRHSVSLASRLWGVALVDIPFEMLTAELESLRQSGTQANQLRSLLDDAEFFREANEEDLRKSSEILQALRNLARKQHLDALTLRCFDLVLGDKSTGCLALSVLSDEGIPAGCEGDIPSIITMRWLQLLTGATGWMANPSRIDIGGGQDATMLIAHCTAPRSILAGYGLRSHFESGLGVAVAGVFDKGPVTLVRIGGALLDRLWYAEAQIMESPREEGLCRTQAVIRLPSEKAAELLSAPLGNHLVMIRGHWSRRIAAFASLARLHEKIV